MSKKSVLQSVIQPRPATAPPSVRPLLPMAVDDLGEPMSGNDPQDMEEMLGALVENAPVAMAMFDRDMHYVLANRQWISEFGLQDALPLVGRSQFEVFPNLHPGWRSVYDRAFQGHVVRSEHDVAAAPNGRAMIFRWEVRPWRRKRDAAVGGLMVTCESFSRLGDDLALAPEATALPTPATTPAQHALIDCHLPMVLVDAEGVILEANRAAMEMSLARGIQEGVSYFWDVFSTDAADEALRQRTLTAVTEVVSSVEPSTPVIHVTQPGTLPTQEIAWGVSRFSLAGGHPAALLVGVAQVTFGSAPKFPAAPALPVRPEVAPPPMPVPTPAKMDSVWQMEKRHLEDQLNALTQETRLLQGVEQAFKRRELRQREVLDCMPCGLLVLDERGRPIFHNAHVRALFGHELAAGESVEEWLMRACINDSHRDEVSRLWLESVWRRQLTKVVSLSTADGLLKHFEFRPAPLPNNGGLLVTIHDVTDSCRLEEMLRGAEAKLRTLLQECPLSIVLTDPSGAIFDVNAAAEALFGHPKSELRRTGIDDWLAPESGLTRRLEAKAGFVSGSRGQNAGQAFPVETNAHQAALLKLAIIHDADGLPHAIAHFFEPFLAKSATSAVSAAPCPTPVTGGPLLVADAQGRIHEWTDAATHLFGWSAVEARQRFVHQLFKPSDATGFYTALPDSGVVEWSWFGKDGRKGRHEFELRRLDPDTSALKLTLAGVPETLFATAAMLDSPKAAPTLIIGPTGSTPWPVADLERERLLLTETHHRIKNHLQLLTSLLNLQSNTLDDESAREALRTSQNRVRAVAALHQHLYHLALGQETGLQTFVEDLVTRLRDCFDMPEQKLTVSVDVGEYRLREEWFMPVALILNEALSNAIKHGGPGAVQVRLFEGSDHFMHLTVQDTGPGMPEDFDSAASLGLGLKIIGVFAEQMHGRISIENIKSVGMLFDLRFPMGCVDN